MILSKQISFILKILLSIILIIFITLNFLVKRNINSLSNETFYSSCGISYYNIFNNSLIIKNLNIKNLDNDSIYYFSKLKIKFNLKSFFDETIIINNFNLIDGKINLFQKKNNFNNLKLIKPISNQKKIKNGAKNKEFIIKKIKVNGDLIYTNSSNKLKYLLHIILSGKEISNVSKRKWGDFQLVTQSYSNDKEFISHINVYIAPIINTSDITFNLTGSIENIPSLFLNPSLDNVNIDYSSASAIPNIKCKNSKLDGSSIIIRLNDINIKKDNYETKIKKLQLPLDIKGTLYNPEIDYSSALDILKSKTLNKTIQIIGDKIEEEYDRIEDQTKEKLKQLDEKLGLSEIDDKIEEEYDRIEDQAKEKLKQLDEKLGLSEIDDKIEEEYDRIEDQAKEKLKQLNEKLFKNSN